MSTFAKILTNNRVKLTLGDTMCFQEPPTADQLDSLLEQVGEFLKRHDSSEDTSTDHPIRKAVTIIFKAEVHRARLQRARETQETAADHWSKFRFNR